MSSRSEVVLIGLPAAGKSTIANELSIQLDIPVISLDELAHEAFEAMGFDSTFAESLFERCFEDWRVYVSPFEAQLLSFALGEFKNCIFDVGAGFPLNGNTMTPTLTLTRLLASFRHVINVKPARTVTGDFDLMMKRLIHRKASNLSVSRITEIVSYFSERRVCYQAIANFELCSTCGVIGQLVHQTLGMLK